MWEGALVSAGVIVNPQGRDEGIWACSYRSKKMEDKITSDVGGKKISDHLSFLINSSKGGQYASNGPNETISERGRERYWGQKGSGDLGRKRSGLKEERRWLGYVLKVG